MRLEQRLQGEVRSMPTMATLLTFTESIELAKLRQAFVPQGGDDGLILCAFRPPWYEDALARHWARARYHEARPVRWWAGVVHAFDAAAAVRYISFARTVYGNEAVVTSARAPSRGV